MSSWHENLEGVHREIAAENGSPLHVLAGPGTGKTFAMMRRVARLLEEGVNAEDILALSFTRTAAKDLREQLERLGTPRAANVRASTLHSLCFGLLNQAAVFAQTGRVARPLLSYEVKYLELDLKEPYGGLKQVRRLLAAYEAAWARLQTDDPGGPSEEIDVAFHAAINNWLTYHRAMLIGELIPLTLRFARDNPVADLIPQFAHVLVDEYQDLNRAEQDLIARLASTGTLTVIGDDCQSIYSFRHANPQGIRDFADSNPGTISLTIEECRRCPPNIVDMSNSLISHEPTRSRPIPLTANRSRPNAHVVIVQHRFSREEVEALSDFVKHYLQIHPELPAGQVLVLAPRRFIGNAIRNALVDRGLNATSYFSEDPVQAASAAEGFALLTLFVDPGDRAALRAWVGMGSTSGLEGGYRRLIQAAQQHQMEPAAMLEEVATGRISISHTSGVVARSRLLNQRRAELAGLTGLQLVREIWPALDEDSDDIRLMAENIAVFTSEPAEILRQLRQEVTQPYLPDSGSDVIRVMSLHKSKGLTASLVIVAGAMAGALPHVDYSLPQADQDAKLQENRRLFYVAITRATDTLVISAPRLVPFADAMRAQVNVVRRRFVGGEQYAEAAMSPFIGELGAACPPVVSGEHWRQSHGF